MSARDQTHRRVRLTPGIALTPMLDVIFNLIFFFILATTIRDETFQMSILLPSSGSAGQSVEEQAPAITLDPEGRTYFKGRPMVDAELELELNYIAGKGGREIAIRGDRRVDYGRVVEVMDICRRSGILDIALELELPQEGLIPK